MGKEQKMSNQNFLVRLQPMEAWFFGSERNLGFGRKNKRTPYFVHSKLYPSQTTLLGGIRFLLQKQLEGLNDDFTINDELIGGESFNLDAKGQSFGVIQKIGSVFVVDDEDNIYIPCPLNQSHRSEKILDPYVLEEYKLGYESENSKNKFVFQDFNVKEYGPGDKFLKIDKSRMNCELVSKEDIFVEKNKSRINKQLTEDGYFKQKMFTFKNNNDKENGPLRRYSFAFVLTLSDTNIKLNKDIITLGSGKCAFHIDIELLENETQDYLEKIIQGILQQKPYFAQGLSKNQHHIYYVASDTLLDKPIEGTIFSVTNADFFRNLQTNYKNQSLKQAINIYNPSATRTVITAGGVIYVKGADILGKFNAEYAHRQMIGMNNLVKI